MKKIYLVLILCFFVIFIIADSQSPQWSNQSTNNTNPLLNDTVEFYIELRDNVSLSRYIFSSNITGEWLNNSGSIPNYKNYFECYQETANESTGCGGLASGSYNSFLYDYHDTYFCYQGNITINYTKPNNTINVIWQIKVGTYDITNYSLSSSCFNAYDDYIILRLISHEGSGLCGGTNYHRAECYDGTSWEEISYESCGTPSEWTGNVNESIIFDGNYSSLGGVNGALWRDYFGGSYCGSLYEEAVFWNITNTSYINQSIIKNITNTTNRNEIGWKVFFNDTSNNWNETDIFTLSITKIKPDLTISILNKPLVSSDALNASISYYDVEGDTWQLNQTKWYKDTIEQTNLENLTSLSSSNTTDGDTWTVSARVFDGFDWSDWRNDSVVIADATPPNISNVFPSAYNIVTTGSLYLYATVIDALSVPPEGACLFSLKKSNQNLGNGLGELYNFTSSKSGDIQYYFFPASTFTEGTIEFQKLYCDDGSGNIAENLSVGINISVTITPTSSGGGGSSTPPSECDIDADCSVFGAGYTCVANKCVKLSREDQAYINLRLLGVPEDYIDYLVSEYGQGVCNWNGICENIEGEDNGNCNTQFYKNPDGSSIAIIGDCTGIINLPQGLINTLIIIAILAVGFLVYTSNKKRRS